MSYAVGSSEDDSALPMFVLNEDGLSRVAKVSVDGGFTSERFEGRVFQILGAKVECNTNPNP